MADAEKMPSKKTSTDSGKKQKATDESGALKPTKKGGPSQRQERKPK